MKIYVLIGALLICNIHALQITDVRDIKGRPVHHHQDVDLAVLIAKQGNQRFALFGVPLAKHAGSNSQIAKDSFASFTSVLRQSFYCKPKPPAYTPEPSSLFLLFCGVIGIFLWRRKK